MSLIWLSPIALFVGLLFSRRLSVLYAAALATVAMVAVAYLAAPTPSSLGDIAELFATGMWIAMPAALVILAGLFFSNCVARPDLSGTGPAPTHRELAEACLVFGPFMETATGFGIGYAVALAAVLRMGVGKAQALAVAALSQYLVPWGALGIGTRISADIVQVPLHEIGWRCAAIVAVAMLVFLPVFWQLARAAGLPPTRRDMVEWLLTMLGLTTLLIVTNAYLPIELAGVLTLGTVLIVRRLVILGAGSFTPAAIVDAWPYVLLVAALAITRLVPIFSDLLRTVSWQPLSTAGPFHPLMSPALLLVVIGSAAAVRASGSFGTTVAIGTSTLRRGSATALLTGVLVGMATIMVGSGISAAVMREVATLAGPASPLTLPFVGAMGGYLTGSNVGAGAMSMPLIAGAVLPGEAVLWIAAAAVFAGSSMTALSPIRLAMGQTLSQATQTEARSALGLLGPYALAALSTTLSVAVFTTLLTR